jgi:hypothetical protein
MGEVMVGAVVFRKEEKQVPIMPPAIDTTAALFSVYPNPVSSGQVYLDMKQLEKGDYNLSIMNASGKTMQKGSLQYNSHNKIPYNLKKLRPGVYFIHLTEEKTGSNFSSKIIVQ